MSRVRAAMAGLGSLAWGIAEGPRWGITFAAGYLVLEWVTEVVVPDVQVTVRLWRARS